MSDLHLLILVDELACRASWVSILRGPFSIIKVTVLGRRVVCLHRFGSLFLRYIGRARKIRVQRFLQCLNKLRFLLFDVSFVGVADKVDVFALFTGSLTVIFSLEPGFLFLKAIEARAVFLTRHVFRLVSRLVIAKVLPDHITEEGVRLYFIDTISA